MAEGICLRCKIVEDKDIEMMLFKETGEIRYMQCPECSWVFERRP